MFQRTWLQILTLVVAACVAGLASNAVRATLEWGGDDPVLVKYRLDDVSLDEASKALNDPTTVFLDVRPQSEFGAAHVRGALSFSSDDFEAAFVEVRDFLGSDMKIIVYGEDVMPAARAVQFLQARGLEARVLDGGFTAWRARQLPEEAGTTP